MTKTIKIPTSKITQFESKQTPTIQQEKNIIKKDNIGTVVPGDALRNINLSTVPSVIEDAIKQMALSVEAKVLANALLLQIQRDIDNLGDAIVEKSYIDGQVTYLTDIVNQKSDKGDVASIVDSKLAIVTPTLATANQVTHLSSRLDESQSSINEVKQTINTEKEALISMIEEAEAKVDENLSNYSAVLNLTVDEDGNIVSQKLESLISQNNNLKISIDELEESMLDEFGNWSAKVAKFITDNNGNITGFSFANGSGQTSKFKINADNFQISNSSNSYVPFKIEGNSLIFNGKVSFTNATNVPNFVLDTTLSNALTTVNENITNKINNLTKVEDIKWQSEVQKAINNNATYIDAGKIVTNQAFVNNLNAIGGIVADSITGNEFNGIVINGARINGSVIKTSYLDLDGELEVLTNYHITVAMYNANPSLYTDAVYISADNEYRIPSTSNISSLEKRKVSPDGYNPISAGTYKLSSGLFSYATANVGHNNKAVKIKPTIRVAKSDHVNGGSLSENQLYHTTYPGNDAGSGSFSFFIGDLLILKVLKNNSSVSYSGLAGGGTISQPGTNSSTTINLSYSGMTFRIVRSSVSTQFGSGNRYLDIYYGGEANIDLTDNWNSGEIYVEAVCGTSSLVGLRLPAISINNMI